MIACVMANAWRGKDQAEFKLSDFYLPLFLEPKKPQGWRQMKAALKAFTKKVGGKVINGT